MKKNLLIISALLVMPALSFSETDRDNKTQIRRLNLVDISNASIIEFTTETKGTSLINDENIVDENQKYHLNIYQGNTNRLTTDGYARKNEETGQPEPIDLEITKITGATIKNGSITEDMLSKDLKNKLLKTSETKETTEKKEITEKKETIKENFATEYAVAEQSALSGLLQPTTSGKGIVTAGIGGHMKSFAIAVGAGYKFKNNLSLRGALSTSFKSVSYNAAVGFEF